MSIKKLKSLTRGFTLIELLVVISIIGMLSSVVLVSLNSARDKGQVAASKRFSTHSRTALYDNRLLYIDFDENGTSIQGKLVGSATLNLEAAVVADADLHSRGYQLNVGSANSPALTVNNSLIGSAYFSSDYSFSLWYKPISGSLLSDRTIMGIDSGTNVGKSAIRIAPGTGRIIAFFAGGARSLTGPVYKNNQWHHILVSVAKVNSNNTSVVNVKLYVNGKLVDSENNFSITTPILNQNLLSVGGACCTSYRALGNIDEVAMYDSPLTAREVEYIYAEGAAKRNIAITN